jgi:hypothetical protein
MLQTENAESLQDGFVREFDPGSREQNHQDDHIGGSSMVVLSQRTVSVLIDPYP